MNSHDISLLFLCTQSVFLNLCAHKAIEHFLKGHFFCHFYHFYLMLDPISRHISKTLHDFRNLGFAHFRGHKTAVHIKNKQKNRYYHSKNQIKVPFDERSVHLSVRYEQ